MSNHQALIVDDEADIRELLHITLSQLGLEVSEAATVGEAKALLAANAFDFCLTDMRMPDGSGMELVEHIQRHHPALPVAMITAHGNTELAVECLKAGAFDFVSKPVELSRLREMVKTALQLRREQNHNVEEAGLTGNSPVMVHLREQINRVARSQAPIFISGESGTGKELVARAIHYLGPRSSGPFIPVNCGAIPAELMESEFFGHRKGSFTGAIRDKQGLFQAADGGTLFLDEVADLP
ncbi:MAG TPA: sigma-54 dependent transcriptional regulator, partial [Porticoccaceae bacterium]